MDNISVITTTQTADIQANKVTSERLQFKILCMLM